MTSGVLISRFENFAHFHWLRSKVSQTKISRSSLSTYLVPYTSCGVIAATLLWCNAFSILHQLTGWALTNLCIWVSAVSRSIGVKAGGRAGRALPLVVSRFTIHSWNVSVYYWYAIHVFSFISLLNSLINS